MLSWIERTAFMEFPHKTRRAHISPERATWPGTECHGKARIRYGREEVGTSLVVQFFFCFGLIKTSFFLDYRTVLPKLRRARVQKRQHWLTSLFIIAPVNLYSAVYSLTSFNHCALANGFVWVWAGCRRNMWFSSRQSSRCEECYPRQVCKSHSRAPTFLQHWRR